MYKYGFVLTFVIWSGHFQFLFFSEETPIIQSSKNQIKNSASTDFVLSSTPRKNLLDARSGFDYLFAKVLVRRFMISLPQQSVHRWCFVPGRSKKVVLMHTVERFMNI